MPAPQPGKTIAFAFDIDGVLIRSKARLPGAKETLSMLQEHNIPFIFLTNGGGRTEEDHAVHLGQQLGLQFSGDQFVQSHSPFRALVPTLKDATVLVLGGIGHKNCEVAKAYGFNNVITSSDIFCEEPAICPFADLTELRHLATGKDLSCVPRTSEGQLKIDAIFVFSNSQDWGLDLQLVMDLLLSRNGILGTISDKNGDPASPNRGYLQDGQPSIYFSCQDLTYAAKYPQPRMARGAFTKALEGIWAAHTGGARLIKSFVCGKPTQVTYEYAEKALLNYHTEKYAEDFADIRHLPEIETVYMIGDNPASDIAGANAFSSQAGIDWKSVLVESGVYEAGSVPEHQPTAIAKGVKEAVQLAFEAEGLILRTDV